MGKTVYLVSSTEKFGEFTLTDGIFSSLAAAREYIQRNKELDDSVKFSVDEYVLDTPGAR